MTDPNTRDEAETYSHFEYVVGPAERSAFANGCASRDSEVASLSRQLAEAQGVIAAVVRAANTFEVSRFDGNKLMVEAVERARSYTAAMGTTNE